jgi:hypothetical protein
LASYDSCRIDWKLNECQRGRPYSSEQAIPTLEELVGVSDFDHFLVNACSDAEADKSLLTALHQPTRPISIEDENQRGIKVIISATAESDSSTIDPASIDGSDSNVLLTRAERCQSRSLRRPHLERDQAYTGRWDASTCNAQLHISEQVVVGGLSEVFAYFFLLQNPTVLVSVCLLQGRHQLRPAELSGHWSVCAVSLTPLRFSGW